MELKQTIYSRRCYINSKAKLMEKQCDSGNSTSRHYGLRKMVIMKTIRIGKN